MKNKGLTLCAFFGMGMLILTSCAGGGHLCDAYGSIDTTPTDYTPTEQVNDNNNNNQFLFHSLTTTEANTLDQNS